jgi:hypothetical protein
MSVWTVPITWVNGAVTAASMNAEIRDHAVFLKGALDLITNSTTADTGTGTYLSITRPNGTDGALRSLTTGDTVPRWLVLANGRMQWSSGSATADTLLERQAAGQLLLTGTDARFYLKTSNAVSPYAAFAFLDSAGERKFQIDWATGSSGIVRFGTLTGSAGSETFTEALRFDPAVPGVAQHRGASSTSRVALATVLGLSNNGYWNLRADGQMAWGDGTAVTDVLLYRISASRLQTDGYLLAEKGLATKAYAGAISDGTFPGLTPQSGTIAVDTTNSRLYVKVGATWKYVALI